nr:hypothetical protein [uncultured Fluviicola sp.]
MRNKNFLLFLTVLIALGCNQPSNTESPSKTNSVWKTEFEKMEEYLPRKFNSKDYFLIFRMGSNEFSSECTMLCIPKNKIKNKTITCDYFSINGTIDSDIQKLKIPTIVGHQLSLTNKFYHSDLNLNKLQSIDFAKFDYFIDSRPREYNGEWHCGNLYVINPNSEAPLLLSRDSRKLERDFFISLYEQISPSEYFQCMALTRSCEDRQDLIVWLQTPQANDSLNFKISEEYWYLPGWNN